MEKRETLKDRLRVCRKKRTKTMVYTEFSTTVLLMRGLTPCTRKVTVSHRIILKTHNTTIYEISK